MYIPYISSAFLDAKDPTYYNVSGVLMYDPSIGNDDLQTSGTAVPFVDSLAGLFPFNASMRSDLQARHQSCGYADYIDKYLAYPAAGPAARQESRRGQGRVRRPLAGRGRRGHSRQPLLRLLPGRHHLSHAVGRPGLWVFCVFCLSPTPCRFAYTARSSLVPGSVTYVSAGTQIYFDRADVKKAIHAPNMTWQEARPPPLSLPAWPVANPRL